MIMDKKLITPEIVFNNRRQFIKSAAFITAGLVMSPSQLLAKEELPNENGTTSFEDATSYNNYYEFGTGKKDPKKYSKNFNTDGWKVSIEGLVDNPITLTLENLRNDFGTEERVYRLRCVEGWSMVIPWNGFELNKLLTLVKPQSTAKYVAFESFNLPKQARGQKRRTIHWPYVEGLRLDEAMHPLTILSTGMYGKTLPNQNGAPIRLVVPWKYGFKSIKGIVKIKLTDKQPETSWNRLAPREYGFYSNVNPGVDHPRWSQRTERVIGGDFFAPRKPTLLFNGYDEVRPLYEGMDLRLRENR